MFEHCVKDTKKCEYYQPYDEASFDGCMYGASEEDLKATPPCISTYGDAEIETKLKNMKKEVWNIRRDLEHYENAPMEIVEKALPKLNQEQFEYCQLISEVMAYKANSKQPYWKSGFIKEDSAQLRGFLDCLKQIGVISLIEVKALHKWFCERAGVSNIEEE